VDSWCRGRSSASGQAQAGRRNPPPTCNKLYTMRVGDTCLTVTDSYFYNDPIPFYSMNPGIDCGAVSKPGPGADSGVGATGVTVCVGSEPVGARRCPSVTTIKKTVLSTKLVEGKTGDSCAAVLNGACAKFKDRKLFKTTAFFDTNRVKDCFNVKRFEFCCPCLGIDYSTAYVIGFLYCGIPYSALTGALPFFVTKKPWLPYNALHLSSIRHVIQYSTVNLYSKNSSVKY